MDTPIENHPHLVKTVVVPAAGLGTRFLPATKTVPKELLPVVDTPGIELIADEAVKLGATRLAVVTSPSKQGILAHFNRFPALEETLIEEGKMDFLAKVVRSAEIINVTPVIQNKPLGLGHAVGLTEDVLDADESVVAVMLPDDLVLPCGIMNDMAAVRAEFGGSVLCAFEVSDDKVSDYGIFAVESTASDDVHRVTGMVEKPELADAPSRFAAAGRYLLDREIFAALKRITPGAGGELQLTDAIQLLIDEGHPVHILIHRGKRHDLGNPRGYIPACVDFGIRHPEYGPTLLRDIKAIIAEFEEE
ncbi:UTP--glucose-1-phosphate uridylyltransferase [Corynebacterium caspium]|uniref:UTP--glucose-1-phosphate uridylyltransferase n=1 Tax=Corynebacterium caspium TaxID=234828 RepID=UPI00036D0FF0|nr:UTP--glucose-1-phosphate uridylyltransferase [Corynebacterium caspium]WKD59621.1 UTP--glucose-1-phosphate uridylyltransferase [Corynebacterium caspium DSM 44850]